MKFLSTVFFVVLTIGIPNVHAAGEEGIPNVHAAWKEECKPLHHCFVTFFSRMHNYSVQMEFVYGKQIEESNEQEIKTMYGYPTTFENYESFANKTLSVLDMILKPFEARSFAHLDREVHNDIRGMVRNLFSCVYNNDKISLYRDVPAPVRKKLFEFYCNRLLTRINLDRRSRSFEIDAAPEKNPLSEPGTSSGPQGQAPPTAIWGNQQGTSSGPQGQAPPTAIWGNQQGTSSAPQGQAPPTGELVINDDCGYLTVGPRAPQQINEMNWWLQDLKNLGTNQDG